MSVGRLEVVVCLSTLGLLLGLRRRRATRCRGDTGVGNYEGFCSITGPAQQRFTFRRHWNPIMPLRRYVLTHDLLVSS